MVVVDRPGVATDATLFWSQDTRVEDAMHATRAAVEEGIVPGGGVALSRCVSALDKLKLEGDEQIGVNIVKRALVEPLRQIAENAGEVGAIVLGKVNDSKDANYGFNALTSSTKTWSRRACSTRLRSCALPCRMLARSRR
jgi:chaperonin GroEL